MQLAILWSYLIPDDVTFSPYNRFSLTAIKGDKQCYLYFNGVLRWVILLCLYNKQLGSYCLKPIGSSINMELIWLLIKELYHLHKEWYNTILKTMINMNNQTKTSFKCSY